MGLAEHASNRRWKRTPHLMLLNRKLVDVAYGDCPRLMVSMPPRHGKSELVSKYFPSWYLGCFPDRRVMLASYEAGFAATWGRKARDVLEDLGPSLFGVRIRGDSKAADRWEIAGHAGGMMAAGVGGPLTGKGANCLIIDDPVKNAEEASSRTVRDKVWEWYQSTAYTRLEPAGSVILVMTRWHEDDLAGRLLREMSIGGERWDILKLPAVAEEDDALGRAPGEALWPERFPLARLEEIRRTVGSYHWQALYQQSPTAPGGEMIKRGSFPIVNELPPSLRVCRYWDKAASKGRGDYTVGCKMAEAGGLAYIMNVIRVRQSSGDVERTIRRTAEADGLGVVIFMEEEGGSSGKDVTHHYRSRVLRGFAFHPVRPTGSKVVRALPFAAAVEQGRVCLWGGPDPMERPSWIGPFLDECEAFPNGEHDDQVDAAAGAFNQIMRASGSWPDAIEATGPRREIPSLGTIDYETEIPGL